MLENFLSSSLTKRPNKLEHLQGTLKGEVSLYC
jgi:hypothetical protein